MFSQIPCFFQVLNFNFFFRHYFLYPHLLRLLSSYQFEFLNFCFCLFLFCFILFIQVRSSRIRKAAGRNWMFFIAREFANKGDILTIGFFIGGVQCYKTKYHLVLEDIVSRIFLRIDYGRSDDFSCWANKKWAIFEN